MNLSQTRLKNFLMFVSIAVVLGISGVVASDARAQDREILTREQWPAVRTGQTIMATEPLKRVVDLYEQTPAPTILIRFPGGNLGNAWAFELRDWFVALGIPSSEIRLEPGSGVTDAMSIMVLNGS